MCFNSSVGILVVRTRQAGHEERACEVSIPRSEFWSFGLNSGRARGTSPGCFNSSVGILVVRTRTSLSIARAEFQFLGRNSGRSDGKRATRRTVEISVSIPRSEFWSFGRFTEVIPGGSRQFQFLGRNSGRSDLMGNGMSAASSGVSIPRSEFWSFGHWRAAGQNCPRCVSIPRSEFWSFGPTANDVW